MSGAAPTVAQVKAQVAYLRQKRPNERIIAIHSPGRRAGPSEISVQGESIHVRQCDSPLHVRETLVEIEGEGSTLVVMTALSEAQLGADVTARLLKGRPIQIKSWEIVKDLFQARDIDPRLSAGWMADMLLDGRPGGSYPAVAGGVLDEDTVWDVLLRNEAAAVSLEIRDPSRSPTTETRSFFWAAGAGT